MMKKFAALLICALMVLSMVAIAITSVSAAAFGTDGVLRVYKKSDTEAAEGRTLDASDPDTKKPLNGATFTIYKVFEHTDDGYVLQENYRTALQDYTGTLTQAKNTANTYVTYGSTDALSEQIGNVQVAIANESINGTRAQTTNTVAISGVSTDGVAVFDNLDYGVYLVVETNPPTGYTAKSQPFFVNIDSNEVVEAYPKNEPFELTKGIGNATSSSSTASYSIGDTVPYIVNTKTPAYNTLTLDKLYADKAKLDANNNSINDYNDYIPFYFTDTLSAGLTLVKSTTGATDAEKLKNSFTVMINGVEYTDFTVTEANAANSAKLYTINFSFDKIYKPNTATGTDPDNSINKLDMPVVITYNAILNENAKIKGDASGTGNINDINLHFKNDPSTPSDPINYDTTTDDPEVFTYEMDLTKLLNGKTFTEAVFDGSRDTKPVFKLYSDITASAEKGIAVQSATTPGVYTVSDDDNRTIADLTVDNNGALKLRGLKAGTYYLAETTAPVVNSKNYTPLTSYITITVQDTVENSKITGTVIATINNGNSQNAASVSNGTFSFNVNNPLSQFDLPTTGGYGILIFTLSAAVVLALAVVLFTAARKKKTK